MLAQGGKLVAAACYYFVYIALMANVKNDAVNRGVIDPVAAERKLSKMRKTADFKS